MSHALHRRLLAGFLTCSVQFSACTGGMLALGVALVQLSAPQGDYGEMSFSRPDQFACTTQSFAGPEDEVTSESGDGGCADTDTCLSQMHHGAMDRSILAVSSSVVLRGIPVIARLTLMYGDTHIPTARAGPIYESARADAYSLRKKE